MEPENPALIAIDRLADLPEGWDSYEAPRIVPEARELAKRCVRQVEQSLGSHYANPLVGPTPEGGVALIWRKERGSEVDVLCSLTGARYLWLNPHRQVFGPEQPISNFDYFAKQVLKLLDL